MKIIMTLLVRDEEDILEENITFHLNQGVDFIIATDNRSIDSSKEILEKFKKNGKLLYLYENEDNYNQHSWVTKMARIATKTYKADWIINNDADEFWWPTKHNSLREALASLTPKYNIVQAKRTNFVFLKSYNTNQPFYKQLIYRETQSLNSLGKPLPPKQAHRGISNIIVQQGNHQVTGFEEQLIKNDLIEIFHFPIRGSKHFINKISKGGAAYEKNLELAPNIGKTWRTLYTELKEKGNIDTYIAANSFSTESIKAHLKAKTIIEDDRLAKYFSNHFHKSNQY